MQRVASMMSELRWALLILGVLFIFGLAWWERRRPRQASGSAGEHAAREPAEAPRAVREALALPEMRARDPLAAHELPLLETQDLPTPPLARQATPAEVRAAAPLRPGETRGSEPALNAPGLDQPAATDGGKAAEIASRQPAVTSVLPRERLPELPAAPAPVVNWPPDAARRIVALRLVAPLPERFPGRSLRQALAAEGFVLGQFAIFHKPDEERRSMLSAASLTRPGTFDMETMDSQHYGGLSLFTILPGPKAPPQAFDDLVFTARSLNERLHGVLQDEMGTPLTPSRIAVLRERLSAEAAS
jgi:cell division protein ZipA